MMPTAEQINQAFIIYANEDACISADNLGTCLRALGFNPTEVEVQECVIVADSNGTGNVSLDKFRKAVDLMAQKPQPTKSQLQEAFNAFDKKGKGSIAINEIRNLLTKMGEGLTEQEFNDMIRVADADGSGSIDVEELFEMMTGPVPPV
ncbi:uncharacterized protein MONBRDRAFT_26207 [Monosiga brevicollis MX1]|uniref:EF-hand domain-containing protein n=1 Tax=Monosiga brevicollis TaxID=81824 RepID=A9V1N7_MONBE|nr:uncharacterized protein MONBRDRAFT_26207 [Monosiga brevicollis MX1]EDQ88597.1 predicted protein [Monosiga brevicollis MX1]|eukprot:XP_001746701.1 hypothetical protein [Monosiga brevicollis MX1]